VLKKFFEKLRSFFDDGGASERMTQDRADAQVAADEETPGHSTQAGQIGVFIK
jgi:hypothetical protein